jgi:Uncharacterised protein family (UPF0158)
MLDLSRLDLAQIAHALKDQGGGFEHRWLIDPRTGEVAFWTEDTGLDDQHPVDLDEVDMVPIDSLPSYVWYDDMVDFIEGISNERAARRLERAIGGRGAFRMFRNELHEEYPELVEVWYAFRDARATRRAVKWLVDNSLADGAAAERFLAEHPDPELP